MPCLLTPFVNRRFVSRHYFYDRQDVSLNEKNETCHILVPNELKNAEHLTVQLGLQ